MLTHVNAADCVESRISVEAVFTMPAAEAECLLTAAISLLQAWQSAYLQVCLLLFSHTSYDTAYT